ncbi:DUF4251 domain-containing protein [Winogradskyella bathintestinalis]|uniref:DUF4251 domain-containing protein n=1 Tax=Winogradskyella bathintestinalis TaxID=3035208 RepID=A0ABT7ZXG0_9FLAO|nr:DUF4251 domain-containing protein [Winogradskyella bathintestinalis]MDN3493697.1 DUF4251 domain-containing protein [Winogradskyella bathintestinalis]
MIKSLKHKKSRLLFSVVILSLLLWQCKSRNISKDESYNSDIKVLESLKQNESYYIDVEVAYPFLTTATQQVANAIMTRSGNSASRIDVRGDGHYISIKTDSVKSDLSFFGESRLNSGHYGNSTGGIKFDGPPSNYEKSIHKQKRKLVIRFEIGAEANENYNVILEIFPNNNITANITSNFRTVMKYSGTLKSQ